MRAPSKAAHTAGCTASTRRTNAPANCVSVDFTSDSVITFLPGWNSFGSRATGPVFICFDEDRRRNSSRECTTPREVHATEKPGLKTLFACGGEWLNQQNLKRRFHSVAARTALPFHEENLSSTLQPVSWLAACIAIAFPMHRHQWHRDRA